MYFNLSRISSTLLEAETRVVRLDTLPCWLRPSMEPKSLLDMKERRVPLVIISGTFGMDNVPIPSLLFS
jgi:hypothetical protein